MIFHELVLQNFGSYGGRQAIALHPTEASPIALLGGMNGGGKTTLLDAIRLALYGQRSHCSTRRTLSYGDFLNQCVHYGTTPSDITSIELTLIHVLDNSNKAIRISRSWKHSDKNNRDRLEVFVDDWLDPTLTETWDEWIEAILPLGISNLFLFDGEQIKELAEQETPTQSVVDAIRSILGLELADRLALDLDILINRKSKTLADRAELKQIESIEQKLAAHYVALEQEEAQCEQCRNQLAIARNTLESAQQTFIQQGGEIARDRTQLLQKLEHYHQEKPVIRQQLHELAAAELPLLLIQPLLHQAKQQGLAELRRQQVEVAADLLNEREQRLIDFMSQLKLKTQHIEAIQSFLDEENQSLKQESQSEDNWLQVDSSHIHQLTHLLEHQLPNQQAIAQSLVSKLNELNQEIDTLERCLALAPSPEIFQQLQDHLSEANIAVEQWATKLEISKSTCQKLERDIQGCQRELAQYGDHIIERQNTQHLLRSVTRTQHTLEAFREELTRRKLSQLETRITECFLYLLHKENLVHRITVNDGTFSLSLFDAKGQPIPKHRLSAGEKQLLAIAFLWGLARASGRQLPVAIDTPLGRLDSKHRQNLVERYFPQASHQVILLSTDTELRDQEVKILREQGAIACEYLLHYDEKKRCTTVQSGYFW